MILTARLEVYYKRPERICRHHLVLNLVLREHNGFVYYGYHSFLEPNATTYATANQNVWLQVVRPPHIRRNKTFLKLRRCLFPSAGPSHNKNLFLAVVEHLSVLFRQHPSSHRCSLEALFLALWRGGFWEFSKKNPQLYLKLSLFRPRLLKDDSDNGTFVDLETREPTKCINTFSFR